MDESFIPFSPPMLDDDEIGEVTECLQSGWLTTGPKCREFEQRFAARLQCPAALALNSCTAALHTALAVLGIGPGDEVITSTFTFVSTVSVIEHVGARPVLVDVERDTLNLDPEQVAAAITPRTKALIPVHYAGHPCDMDSLRRLARNHGLAVVEDAAHALPAKHGDTWIGQGDNPCCFSFYATKNLSTGEGGMLTGSPEFIERARVASLHGMNRDAWKRYDKGGAWFYEVVMPGFKYNLPDVLAAIGLAQLRKLDRMQARRREVAASYREGFADLPLDLPCERPGIEHAWHLFPVRVRTGATEVDRAGLIQRLADRNIGTSVHFIPVHLHPYYRQKYGWRAADFPVAFDAYQRIVSLPFNAVLSPAEVTRVIDACRAAFGVSRT